MCRFRRPGMGRKKEMVQGDDDFECLIFFSYIEDEKMGRPLGDLDRSRKPFWREFDEYMHERGEKSSNLFYPESAREREKPSAQARFILATYSTNSYFLSILSMWPHSTPALPDQQHQSEQIKFATCSCVPGPPSSLAQR